VNAPEGDDGADAEADPGNLQRFPIKSARRFDFG